MTPAEFIAKWKDTTFSENQGSQPMFEDICRLVGHPTPAEFKNPEVFTFEKRVPGGAADAYLEGHFGWEFKGNDSQLDGAFNQLLRYSFYLKQPSLLIVSSFQTILVRTNFPGMETVLHEIPVAEVDNPDNLKVLRCAFHAPTDLRPNRSVEDVTKETAGLFVEIVEDMEKRNQDPEMLARYMNQVVFCLFAEDAGLLPEGLFTRMVRQHFRQPDVFNRAAASLFKEMAGGGLYGADEIAYFNGDLFNTVDAVELSEVSLFLLEQASRRDWSNIEPSIFGTLFERALDASKRTQLGAHYTSSDDIMLVVQPVVMDPLQREWETVRREVGNLMSQENEDWARARLREFQQRLFDVTVLDPACGSGNFLYLALRSLLDLEKKVLNFAAEHSWHEFTLMVKPDQMLGLDLNHYAVGLARTALWIGYIQWHRNNGFAYTQRPILTPLVTIQQMDAILELSDPDNPKEPEWPAAEFIIGNPPFLGRLYQRKELGDDYVNAVHDLYGDRIPNSSDLCCYWFEKARERIKADGAKRAGLLATQAIRFQSNRAVLARIKESGDIFAAISDHDWVLEGANVHTSIICFDDGSQSERMLDGNVTPGINVDLTGSFDLTQSVELKANKDKAYQGVGKVGDFDISEEIANEMMSKPNPHSLPNKDVIKRWIIGDDLAERMRNVYVIDFGIDCPSSQAALYEAPFEYVKERVMPNRINNKIKWRADNWWLHGSQAKNMRFALKPLERYICTPKVSKHRFFVWLSRDMLPSNLVIAIASDEDFTLGVLSSTYHELWAKNIGSQLRESESGGTYLVGLCFKTFPFPEPTEEQREAIAEAARALNELREKWLNPPGMGESELKKRTLTNLYNNRPTWLDNAHKTLDAAVATAYGWPADLGEQEILERLLALNLERAAAE